MTYDDEDPECWDMLVETRDTTTSEITPIVSREITNNKLLSHDRWESLDGSHSATSNIDRERPEEISESPLRIYDCPAASSSSLSSESSEGEVTVKELVNVENRKVKVKTGTTTTTKVFSPGDHIYMHCKAGVIDYQHHGILLEVRKKPDGEYTLKIADFTNNANTIALPTSLTSSSLSQLSLPNNVNSIEIKGLRVSEFTSEDWYVVQYGTPAELCKDAPPGTRTSAFCDCRRLVLARVDFLLKNPHVLPDYELLEANCECVAVWCKTGVWATTQIASVLLDAAVKKAGVAIAATGIAASLPVTIPAEGLLGVAGLTTQVSLLTIAPWIPLLGVLAVGATALFVAIIEQ